MTPVVSAEELAELEQYRYFWLPELRHMPGKHNQATHGHGHGGSVGGADVGLTGQAALDAVPLGSSSSELSGDERASLHAYTRPEHFLTINGSLRGDILHAGGPASPTSDRHIKNLDKVMGRSRVSDDVEVWRGLQGGADRVFGADRMQGNLTGLEWHEKGFMSTSVRKSAAQEFTQSKSAVLMRVKVTKGTGAAKLADRVMDGEGEVVLQRDLKLRVTADHGIDRDWGHRTIDVEVI